MGNDTLVSPQTPFFFSNRQYHSSITVYKIRVNTLPNAPVLLPRFSFPFFAVPSLSTFYSSLILTFSFFPVSSLLPFFCRSPLSLLLFLSSTPSPLLIHPPIHNQFPLHFLQKSQNNQTGQCLPNLFSLSISSPYHKSHAPTPTSPSPPPSEKVKDCLPLMLPSSTSPPVAPLIPCLRWAAAPFFLVLSSWLVCQNAIM